MKSKLSKKKREKAEELAACLWWAVDTPGRSGMVIREGTIESWQSWFKRALKPFGYSWDDELLYYSKLSKTNKARMEKDPKFAKKLAAARAKIAKDRKAP